jgi:DHA1 family bicyclomycin/chloramphenicol resistance-like MFS transporter
MRAPLILFILILASSAAWMSTDLYAPSLPYLPDYFDTSAAMVKLTMSMNLFAYALATLVHGPLSERFGRRPVLLWGMAGFTITTIGCAAAATIGQLLAARVLQGLCAAVEGVVVLAVIRDRFSDEDQVRALAIYGIATGLTPALAPVLGAYIYIWFGWRANFVLLTLIAAAAAVLVWKYLEESAEPDGSALRPGEILRDYLGLLVNARYLGYVLLGGATMGFFFAFITAGPFIVVDQYGLPTPFVGFFQALAVACFMASSLLTGKLVRRCPIQRILALGVVIAVLGCMVLAVAVFGGFETPGMLALSIALFAFADGPIFSTTPTLAMNATNSRTGPAAAMLLAIQLGVGSLAALAVSVLHDGTTRPFAATMTLLTLLMVIVFAGLRKEA